MQKPNRALSGRPSGASLLDETRARQVDLRKWIATCLAVVTGLTIALVKFRSSVATFEADRSRFELDRSRWEAQLEAEREKFQFEREQWQSGADSRLIETQQLKVEAIDRLLGEMETLEQERATGALSARDAERLESYGKALDRIRALPYLRHRLLSVGESSVDILATAGQRDRVGTDTDVEPTTVEDNYSATGERPWVLQTANVATAVDNVAGPFRGQTWSVECTPPRKNGTLTCAITVKYTDEVGATQTKSIRATAVAEYLMSANAVKESVQSALNLELSRPVNMIGAHVLVATGGSGNVMTVTPGGDVVGCRVTSIDIEDSLGLDWKVSKPSSGQ